MCTWRDSGMTFQGRRSPVLGRRGMVASSQPLASEAGLRILRAGGNAMDAAIAIAAALNVTEPGSNGLGGDCFCLYYEAATKKVHGLNGSGRCASGLTLERAIADCGVPGTDEMEKFHAHTVTVPGAAAGWCDSIERFGSKRVTLEDVLTPAIELAEGGFPVSPVSAYWWAKAEDKLNRPNNHQQEVFSPSTGKPPRVGEVFRNPTLATTLRDLASGGSKGFYGGRVGRAIVEVVQNNGGVLSLEDLEAHTSTWVEPISVTYGPIRVWEIPPNGQGLTALLGLNMITALNQLDGLPHNSPDYLHQLIEIMRLAFADTRWYIADPAVTPVPVSGLLDPAYAASRVASFDPTRAQADVEKGQPDRGSHTVSFQVVDGDGNAVSFINSIYMDFGSGLVPEGCGFALQNRGHNFSLNPQHPNVLAPNKRPYHTIIPGMATFAGSGDLFATFSNMGGFMQPQGHVQVLLNMLQFGLDPQTAVDRPRFCITDGTSSGAVSLEEGIPDETVQDLQSRGHNILQGVREGYEHHALFGKAQIISRDPVTGVLWAGSDGRGDGCAMGW